MAVLVPTEEFRAAQQRRLPRAARLGLALSDPDRAQRHRLERDRLVAEDAAERARALGITVVTVDGSRDAESIADIVEGRFARFL